MGRKIFKNPQEISWTIFFLGDKFGFFTFGFILHTMAFHYFYSHNFWCLFTELEEKNWLVWVVACVPMGSLDSLLQKASLQCKHTSNSLLFYLTYLLTHVLFNSLNVILSASSIQIFVPITSPLIRHFLHFQNNMYLFFFKFIISNFNRFGVGEKVGKWTQIPLFYL